MNHQVRLEGINHLLHLKESPRFPQDLPLVEREDEPVRALTEVLVVTGLKHRLPVPGNEPVGAPLAAGTVEGLNLGQVTQGIDPLGIHADLFHRGQSERVHVALDPLVVFRKHILHVEALLQALQRPIVQEVANEDVVLDEDLDASLLHCMDGRQAIRFRANLHGSRWAGSSVQAMKPVARLIL